MKALIRLATVAVAALTAGGLCVVAAAVAGPVGVVFGMAMAGAIGQHIAREMFA